MNGAAGKGHDRMDTLARELWSARGARARRLVEESCLTYRAHLADEHQLPIDNDAPLRHLREDHTKAHEDQDCNRSGD